MTWEPMKSFLFQTQAHAFPLPENCAWLFVIVLITGFVFALVCNQAFSLAGVGCEGKTPSTLPNPTFFFSPGAEALAFSKWLFLQTFRPQLGYRKVRPQQELAL